MEVCRAVTKVSYLSPGAAPLPTNRAVGAREIEAEPSSCPAASFPTPPWKSRKDGRCQPGKGIGKFIVI